MKTNTFLKIAWIAILLAAPAAAGAADEKLADFLARIASADPATRLAARREAPEAGLPAILPLAKLMSDDRLDVRVAAAAALERIVHHAGRPEADAAEREAACVELRKLLQQDQPAGIRREAVNLIGYIASDTSVPEVVRLLGDSDRNIRETARLTLERIPGPAAVKALIGAAQQADDDHRPDFLYSLSKKGDPAAVPVLERYAAQGPAAVRFAGLEGLARLGIEGAIPLFEKAIADPGEMSRERLTIEYLRLADRLAAGGKRAGALAIYKAALSGAPQDYLREQALHGACPAGSSENLDLLIAGLADSGKRVRALAARRLAGIEGAGVLAALRRAYSDSPRDRRPALLLAMAERDRQAANDLVEAAAAGSDAALKVAALSIRGGLDAPGMEPAYLQLSETGADAVKPIAIRGYLMLARKKLDESDEDEAFTMFGRALRFVAASDAQRAEALRGVIDSGHPEAIGTAAGYLKDPLLGTDAARGVIRLAAAAGAGGDKAKAELHLQGIVSGTFPEDVRNQAVEALKKLGIDPRARLLEQGFVLDWWVTTPIQDPDGKGFEQRFFAEEMFEKGVPMGFDQVHPIGPRRIRWREIKSLGADGRIDLVSLFRRSEKVLVYAHAEFDSPAEREALFKMGSDDGIACFLNGKRIHSNNAARGFKIDEDTVPVKLARGKNRVLLKITQKDGDWAFSFRITDPEGKPLKLAPSGE